MRIKLDENIPRRLVEPLASLGHDVDTVEAEGLTGSEDPVVWGAAQRDGRFLIT
jgi:predicted nuclease of predicted toxin-antitoxin system